VLFEDDNVSMIITKLVTEKDGTVRLRVYLENNTEDPVRFRLSDASVNDIMCDPLWSESVDAGKRTYSTITWYASSLEESGIEEVESITMPISVIDRETDEVLYEDEFVITP